MINAGALMSGRLTDPADGGSPGLKSSRCYGSDLLASADPATIRPIMQRADFRFYLII
jgi:hypothetical protein